MGKRSSEDGQVKKEDYERMSNQWSSAPSGEFQRAPADVLQSRRIIRAKSRAPNVQSDVG
jgi:hypothetical protein